MKCFSPLSINVGIKAWQTVPCGKCPSCLKNRQSDWAFRLAEELRRSLSAFFITLTYEDDYVPLNNGDSVFRGSTNYHAERLGDGFGAVNELTLWKRDVTLFIKRLRRYCEMDKVYLQKLDKWSKTRLKGHKIVYYAVGEYGEETLRPHYHIIMFNMGNPEYLIKAWPFGLVDVGHVEPGSIHYVTGYVHKKNKHPEGTQKPYSVMSKNIGIGYYEDNGMMHKLSNDFNVKVNGFNKKMPRYYKDKIFSRKEKENNAQEVTTYMDNKFNQKLEAYKGDYVEIFNEDILRRFAQEKAIIKKLKNQKL